MKNELMEGYFSQESERLTYRRLTASDVEDWREFFVDNDRLHFVGMQNKGTVDEMADYWINKQLERYAKGDYGMLAATDKESGMVVGHVGILPRDDVSTFREYEIGYSLKPRFWGKGLGTEMARQMKEFGFEHGVSKRFISMIDKENQPSINVAVKNGMKPWWEMRYYDMDMYVFGVERKSL